MTSNPPPRSPTTIRNPARDTELAPPTLERRVDDLRDLRRSIDAERRRASEFLDKVAILAGPAAIVASMTFVKDIAEKPGHKALVLLLVSWGLLILGSGIGILSQILKQKTADEYDELLRGKITLGDPERREGDYDAVRPLNDWTRRLLWLSLIVFVLGIVLMIAFATASLIGVG
jgi:hypothetical protein